MTRDPFDIGVGTSAAAGIIEVAVSSRRGMVQYQLDADCWVAEFPFDLDEAKTLRDMLNDAIEHVEAGGHGT